MDPTTTLLVCKYLILFFAICATSRNIVHMLYIAAAISTKDRRMVTVVEMRRPVKHWDVAFFWTLFIFFMI